MFKDFFSGISAYRKAISLIPELKLWKFILLPWFISLLLLGAVFYFPFKYADRIGDILDSDISISWLDSIIDWVITGLGGLALFFCGLFVLKYLVLIICGPFMSALSQKVETALTGAQNQSSFNLKQAAWEFSRGIRLALRNLFKELGLTIVFLFIGIIVAPVGALGLFLIQAYYFGFGNLDFALERHFGVKESVAFVKQNKGMAIGNGAVIVLVLAVAPTVFSFLIALVLPVAAFIMPIGVIAATIETVKRLELDSLEHIREELV